MKTAMISLTASALVLGLGLATFADGRDAGPAPVVLQGKDRPILLARMVVTATPLPDRN